jgi:hypothetical protein
VPRLSRKHARQQTVGEHHCRPQIHVSRPVDLIDRKANQLATGRHTGVGDQNVDCAGLIGQSFHVVWQAQVSHDDACGVELACQSLERILVTRREHQQCSFGV